MGYTAPTTRATGNLITASIWNVDLVDNLAYLKTQTDAKMVKEIFFPVSFVAGTNTLLSLYGDWVQGSLTNAADYSGGSFNIPSDFTTLTEAKVLVMPKATQASANWDIYVGYASIGQAYNAHQANNTAATYNVTADVLYGIDFSIIMTALAAGDAGGYRVISSDAAHDVGIIGLRIKYT